MAVYGNTDGGTQQPLVDHLTTDNVLVTYSTAPNNFGVNKGTVTVQIQNYDFNFASRSSAARSACPNTARR